jgi:SP family general alpha glucoside:H+ symporter-like MFS transporter
VSWGDRFLVFALIKPVFPSPPLSLPRQVFYIIEEMLDEKRSISPVQHIEDNSTEHEVNHDINAARDAAALEHTQTLWQALKAEPRAVFWSVAVSTAIISE